ncbi:MAG TPA: HEAT repeat domain-containing protein [Candidatus Rifleibacterium sp.]|nr:HEAT repeat domain-containing protein [Candidatus Rifleibacterium sp.]HPT47984.1 HEAT repeat domain-containing protein [Candidatus Rifleibacterium sp.]
MIWPFGSKKDPELLIKDLENSDAKVREAAFHGLIAHTSPQTDRLVLAALEAFNISSNDVILPLIDVAGQRGIDEALPVFKALLKGSDTRLRESALQAISALKNQESLDIMITCLTDSDPGIKQKVQQIIIEEFGNDAMGALLRALPSDRNSSLYFEIVSIMEELDMFTTIRSNFEQPDILIKEFYFDTLIKFNRPDFVPLYLEFYPKASQSRREKIAHILLDYSVKDLIPHFMEQIRHGHFEGLHNLSEQVLIARFEDAKEEILDFVCDVHDTRFRLKVLPDLLKKIDPYCFEKGLDLLKDASADIRNQVLNALTSLIKRTWERLNDKNEPNKMALAGLYDSWEKRISDLMRDRGDLADDQRKNSRRLFYAMTQNRHSLIRPFIKDLLQKNFHETFFFLKEWPFDEIFNLFHWLIESDSSFGSLMLTALQGNNDDSLWRLVLKLANSFPDLEDRETFKRNLVARNRNIAIEKFLKDPDPDVRVAAIEFASECKMNGLVELLKSSSKDPAPQVRLTALKCLNDQHFAQIQNFLVEALHDPDESVAFFSLKLLKEVLPSDQFAPNLVRFINSNSEKLRNFALGEIATLTKERYKANFARLTPEVRKLAGKVIQKIDQNFTDQVIDDLSSLDPQTRLQAALLLENIQIDEKCKDALLAAMKDPSKLVRAAIVKTLGVIGDNKLIKQLISFFNDPDPRVRANTIEAIATLGDRQAIQILLPFLEDNNNRIRANALVGIRKIGNFNIVPIIQKMLTHHDANMRASALWAMGEIKDPNYLNFIFPYLNDRNEMLRFNAIRAISRINPQMLSQYMPMLRKDPSPKIKKLVAELSYKVL